MNKRNMLNFNLGRLFLVCVLNFGFFLPFAQAQKKETVTMFKESASKWNTIFKQSLKRTLVDFTQNNVYLMAGMNVSKQNISTGNYQSNFNYDLSDNQKDVFKSGYFAGLRVDGKYKQKHNYSFGISLHKLVTGTYYKEQTYLNPFVGSFSKFKADDQFLMLSIEAHYKQPIVLGDTTKYKFYCILGPSLDTRLSGQSDDNLINSNYRHFLLRGDIGLEFDNKSYYTLFAHYKYGISSFTRAPISTQINSVELGMMIKASDLF